MMSLGLAPGADLAPLALGPVSIGRITATGMLHAAVLLASVAMAARLAQHRGLRPRLIIETHAIAVPVAIILARAGALIDAFPAFLHDGRVLGEILTSAPSPLPALAGVALLLGLIAWATGRPRALADCMAPGAVVVAGALLLELAKPTSWGNGVIALIAVVACPVAHRLAMRGARPGEAGLVAAEALVLMLASTLAHGPIPSLALVACAVMLGLLLLTHVLLRVRSARGLQSGALPAEGAMRR